MKTSSKLTSKESFDILHEIENRKYPGKVTEAFNAFIVKILGEGEFERVIENAGIRCENE